ncbi:MAG: hypothetical protein V7634_3910 [Bradyrhizobium sp.]|jgi:hypothetical protein
MAGLVPAIHVERHRRMGVDARTSPGMKVERPARDYSTAAYTTSRTSVRR